MVRADDDGRGHPADRANSAAVPAFWCRIPSQDNVGDRLTLWLIRRITGQPARWVPPTRALRVTT